MNAPDQNPILTEDDAERLGFQRDVIQLLSAEGAHLQLSPTSSPFSTLICTVQNGGTEYPIRVSKILGEYFAEILGHQNRGNHYEFSVAI
jgi:hypothetical protein